jgi:hypothetical protein
VRRLLAINANCSLATLGSTSGIATSPPAALGHRIGEVLLGDDAHDVARFGNAPLAFDHDLRHMRRIPVVSIAHTSCGRPSIILNIAVLDPLN